MTISRKAPSIAWKELGANASDLRLNPTLICGQAFRWKPTSKTSWACSLWGHAIELKQEITTKSPLGPVEYRVLGRHPKARIVDIKALLVDYFQLSVNLPRLCDRWASLDCHFAKIRESQRGVRILRQPVVENLFTFIASSNNNIKRITMLVDRLCEHYGDKIEADHGGFYTFPTVKQMAQDKEIEGTLKGLGFGYRARYYSETIKYLTKMHGGDGDECAVESWLASLRSASFETARAELMKLTGVGPKVADCVCLMSLDKHQAVPVDTHIWQVAKTHYVPAILDSTYAPQGMQGCKVQRLVDISKSLRGCSTVSSSAYALVQSLFVCIFGEYAGWAQGMLFSRDLNAFDDGPNAAANAGDGTKAITKGANKKRKMPAKALGVPGNKKPKSSGNEEMLPTEIDNESKYCKPVSQPGNCMKLRSRSK